jgi:single-strand DNA-binding protein
MHGQIECAFIGRAGADPELRTSQAGKPWLRFNVAVGQEDAIQWVQVACFGERAEQLAGIIQKGDRIYVEGSVKLNTWVGKEGEQRSGLSVAAWKAEKLGQIGRNRPPATKQPNSAPKSSGIYQRAARDHQRPLERSPAPLQESSVVTDEIPF